MDLLHSRQGVRAIKFPGLLVNQCGNDTILISQSSRFCQHSENKFASDFASVGVLNEVAKIVLALAQIVLDDSDKTIDNKGRIEC